MVVQEKQHSEQLKNYKASQQRLVIFCKKLENKRKEEKNRDQELKEKIKKLNSTLQEKSSIIDMLEEVKGKQEEETIGLRYAPSTNQ